MGERYLLYVTDHIENNLMMKLFDLDAGENVPGRIEDRRKDWGKARQRNGPVFDDTRDQAAYTTWWFEGDSLTLTLIRFLGES